MNKKLVTLNLSADDVRSIIYSLDDKAFRLLSQSYDCIDDGDGVNADSCRSFAMDLHCLSRRIERLRDAQMKAE